MPNKDVTEKSPLKCRQCNDFLSRFGGSKRKRKQDLAFEAWRKKLNRGDRLPRGRYFVGKYPGSYFMVADEWYNCWVNPPVTSPNLEKNNNE